MPRPPWPLVRALSQHAGLVGAADADLLARFAADRDPAAFELLVWRHGKMVLAVCRRVLGDPHRADDAFQATFLILARKAGSVRGSAAGYLHRVARRVAVRAAQRDAVRTRRETSLTVEPFARAASPADPLLRTVLDEEIDRLPDRLRLPVVLCYLDGRSTEEAAGLLGVPRGTVLSRLSAARATLASRLTRRGVAAPAAGLAAVLGGTESAMSGAMVATILSSVGRGTGTGPAFLLAGEVMRAAIWQKLTAATMAAVLVGGTGVGVVRLTDGGAGVAVAQAADPPAKPAEPNPPVNLSKDHPVAKALEREAKLLPERIARIDEEIAVRTDRKLRAGAGGEVDVQALANALAEADSSILNTEDGVRTARRQLVEAKRLFGEANTFVPTQTGLETFANQESVSKLRTRLKAVEKSLAELSKDAGEKAEARKKLEAERVELTRVWEAEMELAARNRTEHIAMLRRSVSQEEHHVKSYEFALADWIERRQKLAARLADARRAAEEVRHIDDQLQVIREVRQQLFRRQLLAEFGAADLPAGPAAGGADKLDQLARDVADLKAALRTADGQDKLDALRQAVDALAAQVRAGQKR